MASKSPSELVRDVQVEVATLKAQLASLENQVGGAGLYGIRERLAVLESLVAELKKLHEEADRRRWQLWLGIATCVVTFGANATLNLLLFFARK